ncbi:14521_t:CDS:1, partial [Entrophospora sp. SA101]
EDKEDNSEQQKLIHELQNKVNYSRFRAEQENKNSKIRKQMSN